jgi:hypothetical protein
MRRTAVAGKMTIRLQNIQDQIQAVVTDVDDVIQSDLIHALESARDAIDDVRMSLLRGGL